MENIRVVFKDGHFLIGKKESETDDKIVLTDIAFLLFDLMGGRVAIFDFKFKKAEINKNETVIFEPDKRIIDLYIQHTSGIALATPTIKTADISNLKVIK